MNPTAPKCPNCQNDNTSTMAEHRRICVDCGHEWQISVPEKQCFMCHAEQPKYGDKWIESASTNSVRLFCSKYCHYNYAMGSDMT